MSLNADLIRARCGEIEESLLGDLRAFVGVVSQLV
jgi:hypothetical protein